MTYATPDRPFVGSAVPGQDIASARLVMGILPLEVKNRSGVVLTAQSSAPSLALISPGPIPAPPALQPSLAPSRNYPSYTARPTTAAERRASVLEGLVAVRGTASRRLRELRRSFGERKVGHRLVFSRQVGPTMMEVVFDSSLGAVVEERVRNQGALQAETLSQFETVNGVDVLTERRIRLFDRQGRLTTTSLLRRTDITIR